MTKAEPAFRPEALERPPKKPPVATTRREFDDSLSSLSIESEDDANFLSQAMAGLTKNKDGNSSEPIKIPRNNTGDLCNDSISSIDSTGKDDGAIDILEQCIYAGKNAVVKKESSRRLMTSSPKKSMLPTLSHKAGSSGHLKLDKRDEELQRECIANGIFKNTRTGLTQNLAHLSISDSKNACVPKNAKTSTSVIVQTKCASTIAGVEEIASEKNRETTKYKITDQSKISEIHDRDESIASRNQPSHQENWKMPNGSSTSFDLNLSLSSTDDNILERSNEYPAAKLSMGAYGDFDCDDSIMEETVSNEFMVENKEKVVETRIDDKHKDPDLMMKSVDRLTQELVSTAEYLRKNTTLSDEISLEQKISGSLSNNNTWNDDNSFPSISASAPMIGSTNDEATIATDQVYTMPEERLPLEAENNFLDDKTPTNENYKFDVADGPTHKVDFKVGGEINHQAMSQLNFVSFGPVSIETSSTMSNSTIVQAEAKKIVSKMTLMTNLLMDSTSSLMDLENVRPPSSMDCISLSSYQECPMQQSPMRQAKKSLFTGLVVKRALGHQTSSASVESVHSIHNLDSIRAPSIMDELLDSMISVDSIVSEIVDPTTMGISNYETALSDVEDSLTLRSCTDLLKDDTLTGTSSDFSSVESTPKKRRNFKTGKSKQRQSDERYKTYTIQVDMLLKEQQEQKLGSSGSESMRKSLNARQKRRDRQRFETQVIDFSPSCQNRRHEDPGRFKTFNVEQANELEIDDDPSIRAMTEKFAFLRSDKVENIPIDTADIKIKLNQIKSASKLADDSLEYDKQTSETESQRDLKYSLNYDANSSVDEPSALATPSPEQPKVKATKASYISPYRMTTRLPMKNKAVKVTKTPVIAKVVTRNPVFDSKCQNGSPKSNGKVNIARSRFVVQKPATNPTQSEVVNELQTMPIRQATFIKDEPTLENVPVVNDAPTTPAKTTLSKLKRPSRVPSSSKIQASPTEKAVTKKASNLPSSISQLKFRSNSNASLKSPISGPVRSNTGINFSNQKKVVSSKIASIWKTTDKKESLLKKPTTSTGVEERKLVNIKTRIKRSSTCDEIGF